MGLKLASNGSANGSLRAPTSELRNGSVLVKRAGKLVYTHSVN